MHDDPDVIVIGAGPVGLTAALALAQAGVRVTLVEKRPSLSAASRASTIHPPTLEILERLGVLDGVQRRGTVARHIHYRTPDGIIAAFDLACLSGETRFPYRLHLEQSEITPAMLGRLRSCPNARVLFGAEVTGVQTGLDSATVTIGDGPLRTTLAARYVIAADGARSVARSTMGLRFDGVSYPHKILRLMTDADLDALLPGIAPVTYLSNGIHSVSFLRMPDCWRMILRVPGDVDEDRALDEDWALSRFQAVLPRLAGLPRVVDKDVYGVSRRVASRFRDGRSYLAGDAAHVTNTRGGMNMNCGIHDAAALADAMIATLPDDVHSRVDEASDQRRQVAEAMLIPRTDRSVAGGVEWLETLRATAADPGAAREYLRTAAMLDMLDRARVHA